MSDGGVSEKAGRLGQLARPFVVEGRLQRAAAAVFRLAPGRLVQPGQEPVVACQTPNAQAAEGRAVAFDIRGEDAGRCVRGTAARGAGIEHLHACAPASALEGHGRADDTGTDDNDPHLFILSLGYDSHSGAGFQVVTFS